MEEKNIKRKDWLKMPHREGKDIEREYKYLLVVPAGTKHDSGYMHIAIIGAWVEDSATKYEICSYPDDIHWIVPDADRGGYKLAHLRTDCFYPSGVLKFWGSGTFKVDWSSSTNVEFFPKHN